MREPIIKSIWEYRIEKSVVYGWQLWIYQNNMLVYSQGGFGAISAAECAARDYFLASEFGIERGE